MREPTFEQAGIDSQSFVVAGLMATCPFDGSDVTYLVEIECRALRRCLRIEYVRDTVDALVREPITAEALASAIADRLTQAFDGYGHAEVAVHHDAVNGVMLTARTFSMMRKALMP